MSRPKGLSKTGGRKAGVPNKATAEIKEIAGQYGEAAIHRLAHLMKNAVSESAQVAAANGILDRAYGKPPQAITGEGGGPLDMIVRTIREIRRDRDGGAGG